MEVILINNVNYKVDEQALQGQHNLGQGVSPINPAFLSLPSAANIINQ